MVKNVTFDQQLCVIDAVSIAISTEGRLRTYLRGFKGKVLGYVDLELECTAFVRAIGL